MDDYVNLGQFEDYPKFNSSISFWFKSDTLTSEVPGHEYVAVFSKDCYSYCQKFLIGSNSVNDIGYYSMFSNTNSDNLIQNEWYFVVGTRNSSTGISKLYVNGELIDNQYINGVLQDTLVSEVGEFTCSSELFLGIQAISNPTHFYGLLDDVVIWNKELTQEEIQTYMFCPPTGNEEGLVGYWNFNEGQGNTLNDISGNENHGLINGGATYSEDVPEQNCEVSQSDGLVLAEALNQGLIAYYPFNGNADDASANGNHGIAINATLIDDRFGATNNAYEFDANFQFTNGGAESYIQLPEISTNIGAPNSSFSISMWFNSYDPSALGNIILNAGKGGDGNSTVVGRVEVTGNKMKIYHRNPSTNNEPSGSINIDSNWNNVIVMVDGELGQYKLFVNGDIDNSMTFSFNPNETYFDAERIWQIGGISYMGQNNHQFHGAIDDVSFWDRILTDDEIQFLSSNNILYGCTNIESLNYNPFANSDDNSCVTYQYLTNSIESLQTELANLNEQVTTSLSSLQQALDNWNTTIDLSAGWNMFGYGCPSSIDVAQGLTNHTERIIITKANNGNVYMPEFGFNGIGDFTPGFGYQIKLSEAIDSFSLCDWYVNDIPEDNIVSLQEENAVLQAELDSIQNGCTDSTACNYNSYHLNDDGSCEYAEQGYDCDGNLDLLIEGFIYIGSHQENHYFLSENLTYWEDANLICNENGGHLVTISDNEENMFISNALINSQSDNLIFENWELRCEIGLKKVDDQWIWVTGEPVTFTNWSSHTNEPNNTGNCAHTNHDIYHPNYGSNYFGYWNDHSCNSGETRFILEIEN